MKQSAEHSQDTIPSFGEWVRMRRRALDLTQDELARLASCARVTIRKIESEELLPSKELAQVLAEKLGVPAQARDQFVKYARSGKQPKVAAQLADISPWRNKERRHNLPESLTTFIGRKTEIAEIIKLLSTARLVTLTGAGGVGKTRLSLQVGASLADAQSGEGEQGEGKPHAYPDGVWLLELAPLSDPSLVSNTIANVLGVREEQGRPLAATLTDWLRDKHLLLVLDNCEHLIEACAQFADAILKASRDVRILATSREALRIVGESVYRVPSLEIPNPKHQIQNEQLARYTSVRLFIERARQSLATFAVNDSNAPAIAQICIRLDGIPLAIELAAVRVSALSVERISEELDDRFRLLTGGSRAASPRQQTLRAMIDWSHNLLSQPEQVLWRRLSVFAGGWTREAAESVCNDDAEIRRRGDTEKFAASKSPRVTASDVLELLANLVDKSLVVMEERGADTRYRLLETIRQYAHEKLLDAKESEPLRDRHLDFFLKLAERSESLYYEGRLYEWIPRLEAEHDNVRAALEWACQRDPEKARWLAGLLRRFWVLADHLHEARVWYARVLDLGDRLKIKGLAIALLGAGMASAVAYLYSEALRFLEEGISLYRELDDKPRLAESLSFVAYSTLHLGHDAKASALFEENESLIRESAPPTIMAFALSYWGRAMADARSDNARAKSLHEESLAIGRALKDADMLGVSFMNLGHCALEQGDYQTARQYHLESLAWRRKTGSRYLIAIALMNAGDAMSLHGDYHAARALYEEALTLSREMGDQLLTLSTILRLGYLALHLKEYEQSMKLFAEDLAIYRGRGDHMGIASCLAGCGELHRVQGRTDQAARLLGYVEALLQSSGRKLFSVRRIEYERSIAAVRAQLDEASFDVAWDAGRAMTMEQAMQQALEKAQ